MPARASRPFLRPEPPPLLAGLVASVLAVAVITALIYPLRTISPAESNGVAYLLAVLLIATIWGLWLGLLTSVLSSAAFNFFTFRRRASSRSPTASTGSRWASSWSLLPWRARWPSSRARGPARPSSAGVRRIWRRSSRASCSAAPAWWTRSMRHRAGSRTPSACVGADRARSPRATRTGRSFPLHRGRRARRSPARSRPACALTAARARGAGARGAARRARWSATACRRGRRDASAAPQPTSSRRRCCARCRTTCAPR